ncbi:hypothetical protein CRE_00538 [Caenorhabditis remanei]|uniref:Uncharacterized protein n=1 Tax=Caenorhabditis remanei TaxID=31234 RepID=E3LCW8_CAERE|nr:hypothetical protein CRE_00538 [Caenorhabditis remanei]
MSIGDVQRHITVVTLGSPAAYLFLRLLQKSTGRKFPESGPNELLFFDCILAMIISIICSHRKLLENFGFMVALTVARGICLFILGMTIFYVPQWFITHEPRNHTICWIFLSIYIMCTAASLTMCIAAFLHECDFEEYSCRRLIECCLRKNNEHCPPEYQEAISTSALPPTYEEAIASRPPGYTPTSTPPVVSPSQSPVNITRNTVRYNCYQAEMEEAETMF